MSRGARLPRGRAREVARVLLRSLAEFYRDDSLTISASIAYYSVLSLFPLLLLLLSLSGVFIRHFQLTGRLAVLLERVLPMKPDFILINLQSISRAYGPVGVASFLLLLWSSAGVFLPIEKSLNRAWGIETERTWLERRVLALGMALLVGFLILVSSDLVGAVAYVHRWAKLWSSRGGEPIMVLLYRLLGTLAGFGLTFGMFVVLFERLPNRPMRFRHVFPSALLTALLWQGARSLFTFLFRHFNYHHVYGSIGAMVAFMTWAYVSAAIMLYGARASAALYRTLGANDADVSLHHGW